MTTPPTGARVPALELLRGQGLLPDGPLLFGQPVPSARPGVYLVEWPTSEATAPIDHNLLRAWLARVPTLRLDGEVPTPHDLAARLAGYWLPDQTIVYIGMTTRSLRRRLADFAATPLGDAGPHRNGAWLKTLRGLDRARIWWAETDAAEEYEDALLTAFGVAVGAPGALPFGNLKSLSSGARAHGLTGDALAAESDAAAHRPTAPTGRSAPGSTPTARARAGAGRAPSAARPSGASPRRVPGAVPPRAQHRPVVLTADGLARIEADLHQLRDQRPDVIGRVKAARELGDLRENSEYHAAREEQSFLEGRIQQLQATLDRAVVTEAVDDGLTRVGSIVDVAVEGEDGETATYTLVDPAEARLAEGRLSYRSPIGAALLGRHAGDVVTVSTPAGPRTYRVVAVR
ncbi:MAG: GreA/GreB family elongation factor [Candidatus Limnocylindrales bacterium]